MATIEATGLMRAKDAKGNEYLLYPITKADAVDGLAEFLAAATIKASQVSGLQNAIGSHTHSLSSLGAAASSHTHTPASIGAAAASHNHSAAQITSGTLSQARGGTGSSSLQTAVNALLTGGKTSVIKSIQFLTCYCKSYGEEKLYEINPVNVAKSVLIPSGFIPYSDTDEVSFARAYFSDDTHIGVAGQGSEKAGLTIFIVEFY